MSIPTGWLSPEGRLHECDYMNHITEADKIIKEYGYEPGDRPDDILMDHGWAHLTRVTFMVSIPQWCIFWKDPWRHHLTEAQKHFLKPYMEEYKDFLYESCFTDLKYEFEDLFM